MSEELSTRTIVAPTAPARADRGRLRRAWPLLIPVVFLLVVFLYPVLTLLLRSFSDPQWGFQNYVRIFTDGYSITVILRTLLVAAIVTVVTLVISFPFAYTMTVVSDRARGFLTALVLLPFWTSAIVRSFAWVVLLQPKGPVNTLLALVGLGPLEILGTATGVTLAMSQVLLPFMTLPLYNAMKAIDPRLMPAAASLGAKPITRFFRVFLPLSAPGMTAGCVMVFILALGFFITPALLGSPRESLVAQLMTTQVQQNLNFGVAGALATVLLLSAAILLSVAAFTGRSASLKNAVGGQLS